MPGSSLWLLPPPSHPLTALLTQLIHKTSSHFQSPHLFVPHITLTSEIYPSIYDSSSSPQEWLDSLPLSAGPEVEIRLGRLCSEEGVFVRKLYSLIYKADAITALARVARENVQKDGEDKEVWAKEVYVPHLSLLYSDIPKVDDAGLEVVRNFGRDLGVGLDGEGGLGGWLGGRVVLVPTDKAIEDWVPIATRDL